VAALLLKPVDLLGERADDEADHNGDADRDERAEQAGDGGGVLLDWRVGWRSSRRPDVLGPWRGHGDDDRGDGVAASARLPNVDIVCGAGAWLGAASPPHFLSWVRIDLD